MGCTRRGDQRSAIAISNSDLEFGSKEEEGEERWVLLLVTGMREEERKETK